MVHTHVMAKPSGSVCNLDCDYCFYLEKSKLYPDEKGFMNEDILDAYIKKTIEAQPNDVEFYTFAWQGGEPTLLGIHFFEKAVEIQSKYANGKKCVNTFQTNGILLDELWCEFLATNEFLVGLSIDGIESQHNKYRKTRARKGTYSKVVEALRLMQRFGVEHNALVVLNSCNVVDPLIVYKHLKELGFVHMQFIPLVERKAMDVADDGLMLVSPGFLGESKVTGWSITPEQYSNFLKTVFKEWVTHDLGNIFVSIFETTLGLAIGERSNTCVFDVTCGGAVVVERNGDVYSCDHFVYPEYKLGNLLSDSLSVMSRDNHDMFGEQKLKNLSVECKSCPYITICNGGCPKHRFQVSGNGMPNKNYFCDGYKAYFSFVLPYMKDIYRGLVSGNTATELRISFRNK